MPNRVLERFQQFKAMFVSSNIPNSILLELIESYINPDGDNGAAESVEFLDGQLSLFDSVSRR